MPESLKGKFLVAGPALRDPNFHRSLILMCEHNDEGAMGIVINRPSGLTIATALAEIPGAEGRDDLVFDGGPVQKECVFILHDRPEFGGMPVADGLGFAGDIAILERLLLADDSPSQFRLYAGYAGWGAGQLEFEMSSESWIVAPVDTAVVFGPGGSTAWAKVLRDLGGNYGMLAQMPVDPTLN